MKRIIAGALLALPFAVISLPLPASALEVFFAPRYHRHRNVIVAPVVVEPTRVMEPLLVEPGTYQQKVWVQGHWDYTDSGRYWVAGHYEYH